MAATTTLSPSISNASNSSSSSNNSTTLLSSATTTTTNGIHPNIILVAKFDYKSKESNELDLKKNERLLLIDNSKNWWLVRRLDAGGGGPFDQTGYVPSNYVKKEKKSLLDKIIPRKIHHVNQANVNQQYQQQQQQQQHQQSSNTPTKAIVKHKYKSNKPDELTLNVGMRVNVIEKFGDGWWKVSLITNNDQNNTQLVGLYPSNYLLVETNILASNLNNVSNEQQHQQQQQSPNNLPELFKNINVTTNQLHETPSSATISPVNNLDTSGTSVTTPIVNTLDNSYAKCESISSNERDIEYLRVIYPYNSNNRANQTTNDNRTNNKMSLSSSSSSTTSSQTSGSSASSSSSSSNCFVSARHSNNSTNNELSVCVNEIVKLVEDDNDCLDYDKSWIKVFNSQGITGMIPSSCVEPIIDNSNSNFVFIRTPTSIGLFANKCWYYGNVSRFETVILFNKYAKNGDFLVRDSDSGNFSISLKSDGSNVKHFKVLHKDSKFMIGKKIFNSMNELIEHYHKNPIYDQNGEKLYLMRPFEPPSFDSLFIN